MSRAIGKRVLTVVLVMILATFFTAAMTSMVRGDTVDVIAPTAPPEIKAQIRSELYLDKPLVERYGRWLGDLVTGDFGRVYTGPTSSEEVGPKLVTALQSSARLMVYAQVLALVLAIPLGVFAAYRAGSWFDKSVNTMAFAFLAVPGFVLGLVMAYYLGVRLRWYPPTYNPSLRGFNGHLQNYFIPTVSLAMGQLAIYLRLLRSDMIATLQEDFVSMARAKGLSPLRILWRHALRPSSLTLLTAAGLNIGALIGGAVIIEHLFSMPGMGTQIQLAVASRQYGALQTYVAVLAIAYIVVNALIDVLYAVLDPRIRHVRA